MGVVATRPVSAGSNFCWVPPEAILVADEGSGGSEEGALAAALLREKKLGAASRLAPYVASLPRGKDLAPCHPLFWPQGLKVEELFAGSWHGQRIAREVLERCERDVAALVAQGEAEEEARWALAIVDSRAFTFMPNTEEEQLALLPLLDLLNTFTLMRDGEALWQCVFSSEGTAGQGAHLSVERDIEPGEEVLHLYSSNSSAMILLVYGFLEDDSDGENPFEIVALQVDATDCGNLKKEKLAALRSVGAEPERLHFELPGDAELGGGMLPKTRLLCCRDAAELDAVLPSLQLEGGPPQNCGLDLERRARLKITEWLRQALEDSRAAEANLAKRLAAADAEQAPLFRACLSVLRRERVLLDFELDCTKRFLDGAEAAVAEGGQALKAFEAQHWDSELGWMGAG